MANLTVKNLPQKLHRILKNQAREHHRSLNKEVIATLQASTEKAPASTIAQQLAEAREMRSKFKRLVTPREIQSWKIEGRRR